MIAQVKIGNVWIYPYKAKAKYLFEQKFEFLSFDFWESYLCLPLYIYTYDLILQHSMGGKILFQTENEGGGRGSGHILTLVYPFQLLVPLPNSNGLIAISLQPDNV